MKIRIFAWNFVHVKDSIRIGYGENFRLFGCTLTEIRLLERLDGLYMLPYKILKNNSLPFFIDMFKCAERTGGVKPRNLPPRVIWFSFCRTVRKSAQRRLQVELALLRPFMPFEIANDFRMYIYVPVDDSRLVLPINLVMNRMRFYTVW
jgi:hypothetical protein